MASLVRKKQDWLGSNGLEICRIPWSHNILWVMHLGTTAVVAPLYVIMIWDDPFGQTIDNRCHLYLDWKHYIVRIQNFFTICISRLKLLTFLSFWWCWFASQYSLTVLVLSVVDWWVAFYWYTQFPYKKYRHMFVEIASLTKLLFITSNILYKLYSIHSAQHKAQID